MCPMQELGSTAINRHYSCHTVFNSHKSDFVVRRDALLLYFCPRHGAERAVSLHSVPIQDNQVASLVKKACTPAYLAVLSTDLSHIYSVHQITFGREQIM